MENKLGLKKVIILSILVVFILNIIFLLVNYIEYKKYTSIFNNKINMIVSNIKNDYPDTDINRIVDIFNQSEKEDFDILKSYGIDIKEDSVILENDNWLKIYLTIEMLIFSMLFFALIVIFLIYNKIKDKKIKAITKYIEDINRGNYRLDIEDNTEDELSILKNEIYKTTVMLNEIADNSIQDKVKLKDSLSNISHQLKTPLTSITIMLDNMLDNKNMAEQIREQFIKDIKREIINLNFLVNVLLKLSKFDTNTIKFVNKDEKINEILNLAVKNVGGLCDLKNIEVSIHGENEATIFCDFRWQVEAITNILKNCIEYSYENSKIDVMYTKNKLYAKIEITDYGKGIDEKDLPHIFEKFYKGKNSSNDSVGIGLALAKSIIEENNGYISATSEAEHGTTFVIKYFN